MSRECPACFGRTFLRMLVVLLILENFLPKITTLASCLLKGTYCCLFSCRSLTECMYFYASATYAALDYVLPYLLQHLSVPSSVSSSILCQIYLFCFTNGFWWNSLELVSTAIEMKWLHFGWNWKRYKGAGYDTIFKSISITVVVMSNRCWCLANEFTNFTAPTNTDAITHTISR